VILYNHDTPRIDFITHIKNRTRNVRIQACFPVPVEQPTFRTEVPFGHVERDPTVQKGNSWGEKNKRFAHYDRIFPAINVVESGTRREELLFKSDTPKYHALRRAIHRMKPREAILMLLKGVADYPTNRRLLARLADEKVPA
jgi:hypothetical protein